jgi:hypothetical protein
MRRALAAVGRHKGWSIGGGVFAALLVIGGVNRLVSGPAASGAQAAASSPAAVVAPPVPVVSTAAPLPSSPAPVAVSSSPAPPPPKPSPSPAVTDLPQFDQDGAGDACKMHYSQTQDGQTITRFTISQSGELITHVSGPGGAIYRHDEQVTANYWAYTAPVALAAVTDMGAVLYLSDGSQQSCAIGPGTMAP